MKKKKFVALLMVICLFVSMSVSTFAAEIQPRSAIPYGSFTIGAKSTKNFFFGGSYFSLTAYDTVTISYTSGQSSALQVYFHNSNTGTNTRVYSSYTPTTRVDGFFYMYNSSSSSVSVSNFTIRT